MDSSVLWSIRLGFSAKNAKEIEREGLEKFLKKSFDSPIDKKMPEFLNDSPKTDADYREKHRINRSLTKKEVTQRTKKERNKINLLKEWWLEKMISTDYPLREKMVCFWHNHFVASAKVLKDNYWIYQHHMILQEHAFGNFKTLTKAILRSNALISYLDGNKNRRNEINENLSRELLELFTLGEGNYTETDVKNGAKALAGWATSDLGGRYRKNWESDESKSYFGKSGNLKVDDLVDIIFEQPKIPYFLTEKILKWFITDDPSKEKIKYYGNYFREVNFELKPLLQKMFVQEQKSGEREYKLKDPLTYILQLTNELNVKLDNENITFFLNQQGMDLFRQQNVKGWEGGQKWLTSQNYLQRNMVVDLLCNGTSYTKRNEGLMIKGKNLKVTLKPEIKFENKVNKNKDIFKELISRLLCESNGAIENDLEEILPYDFNPKMENSNEAIIRVFNYLVKTPEFQVI